MNGNKVVMNVKGIFSRKRFLSAVMLLFLAFPLPMAAASNGIDVCRNEDGRLSSPLRILGSQLRGRVKQSFYQLVVHVSG